MYDYLWRWDTDWFWCSGAFGAAEPAGPPALAAALAAQRRLPAGSSAWRTASASPPASTARAASPSASGSSRTSRCRSSGLPEFLALVRRRTSGCGRSGCARCARRADWPSYPLRAGRDLRQRRLLGHRPDRARRRRRRRATGPIEAEVAELGGHKSLYSDAYYDRETFDRLYGVANLNAGQAAVPTRTTGSRASTRRR